MANMGLCLDCNEVKRLVAGRCENCYWPHRRKIDAEKSESQQKRSVIPAKSAKQLEREIEYAKKRKSWMPLHPICEANLKGCTQQATECHHKAGRSGSLLLDASKWLPVCHACHLKITENSAMAIEKGLSLKRNT